MTFYRILFTPLFVGILWSCTREIPEGSPKLMANYQQKHRPQYHFSPPEQWMNDPNGMVYYEGEYHLFYQFYPDSNVWGPMHWGHAISKDLVRWENLPIALYPDELGYIFSSSAVVDWNNTSGFGTEDHPPLIAIYTYHNRAKEKAGATDYQYQAIAYSNDKGRSWTKYEGNPVLPNQGIKDFRDPKVIWHEPSQKWIMTLAVKDHVSFYTSPDLKSWEFASDFGLEWGSHEGVWECPDLFPLQVEGTEEEKWVLIVSIGSGGLNGGSATQYFVGDFNGTTFQLVPSFEKYLTASLQDSAGITEKAVWIGYGTDNYAGVTWSDIPEEDGRRVFLGWMSNWQYAQVVPTTVWRSAMTIPRVLTLQEDLTLKQEPINELRSLMYSARSVPELALDSAFKVGNLTSTHHIQFNLAMNEASKFELVLSNKNEQLRFELNKEKQLLFLDRTDAGMSDFHEEFAKVHVAPILNNDAISSVEIFTDRSSIEVFINEGKYVFTELVFPNQPYTNLEMKSNGNAQASRFIYHDMNSIWIEN